MKTIYNFLIISLVLNGCSKSDLTSSCQFTQVEMIRNNSVVKTFPFTYDKDGKCISGHRLGNGSFAISTTGNSDDEFNIKDYALNSDGHITNGLGYEFFYKNGYLESAKRTGNGFSESIVYTWVEGNMKKSVTTINLSNPNPPSTETKTNEYYYNDKPNQSFVPFCSYLGVQPKNQIIKNIFTVNGSLYKGTTTFDYNYEYNETGCVTKLRTYTNGQVVNEHLVFKY